MSCRGCVFQFKRGCRGAARRPIFKSVQHIHIIMKPLRLKIPRDTPIEVILTARDVETLRELTFLDPADLEGGVLVGDGCWRFDWTLDVIEDVQGSVAAAANHAPSKAVEARIEEVCQKLQFCLDSFED